jgi:hypothetical protein
MKEASTNKEKHKSEISFKKAAFKKLSESASD